MNTLLLGEWLNGRVAVSKTVGCVFESRLPCQIVYRVFRYTIFFTQLISLPQQVASDAFVCSLPVANNAVPSLRSLRIASPLPNRVSCFSVHDFFYAIFSHPQQVASDAFVCSLPVANNAVPSLRSLRIASPLPNRVSCFSVHDFFYAIFSHPQQVASDAFVCSLPVANHKNHERRKINNI